jgi:hypothetical protein
MAICMTCGESFSVEVWECACGHHNHAADDECGNCHQSAPVDTNSLAYKLGQEAGARAVMHDKDGNPIP